MLRLESFCFAPQHPCGNTPVPHPDPRPGRALPVHRRRAASARACQGVGAKPVRGGIFDETYVHTDETTFFDVRVRNYIFRSMYTSKSRICHGASCAYQCPGIKLAITMYVHPGVCSRSGRPPPRRPLRCCGRGTHTCGKS